MSIFTHISIYTGVCLCVYSCHQEKKRADPKRAREIENEDGAESDDDAEIVTIPILSVYFGVCVYVCVVILCVLLQRAGCLRFDMCAPLFLF